MQAFENPYGDRELEKAATFENPCWKEISNHFYAWKLLALYPPNQILVLMATVLIVFIQTVSIEVPILLTSV